jgi:hypothetical protein
VVRAVVVIGRVADPRPVVVSVWCRVVNALLRRFVELIEADSVAAGFVRRGPVFRYFDADGDGIAVDIQRTTASRGEVAFYVNIGVLFAPHLRRSLGDRDPRLGAMPHHSVWEHRLVAIPEASSDTFVVSADAEVDRAAGIVRTWLGENLPRLKSWLGDLDAMLAAIEADRERAAWARAEQLACGWMPGRWPEGIWKGSAIIRAYAHAERGDVTAVTAETAGWSDSGPNSLAADILAVAGRRHAERRG